MSKNQVQKQAKVGSHAEVRHLKPRLRMKLKGIMHDDDEHIVGHEAPIMTSPCAFMRMVIHSPREINHSHAISAS